MNLAISKIIILYFVTLATFLALDSVWLGKVAPKIYRDTIGHLMADKPNLIAALLFYAIFIVGLLAFVILPALDANSIKHVIFYGLLFGLVTYATFDLTSQAVLKDWPTKITLIDLTWGMFITSSSSAVVYMIAQRFIV